MTKIDWDKFKPIQGFSCLKMKDEIQAAIYEKTKNMTAEEFRAYFRKGSEEFQKEIAEIRQQKEDGRRQLSDSRKKTADCCGLPSADCRLH